MAEVPERKHWWLPGTPWMFLFIQNWGLKLLDGRTEDALTVAPSSVKRCGSKETELDN